MSKKFVLIDGNSLIHRAFYALPLLSTAAGQFTNAAYGFTTMLLRLLEEEKPEAIAVAFDKGKVTFRTEAYQQYKAHRKATPPELREQFPLVHDILAVLGIPKYEQAGFEADDIIGTIAQKAQEEGYQILIVTGDRDALQLISDQVTVLITKKGITEVERYDAAALMTKMAVTPAQIIELKGLMGDASDNIPGVPGVGEKTAHKLIKEYGTIAGVYANLDKISGKKLQERLGEHAALADLSKQLATIDRNVPMLLDWHLCHWQEPDWQAAKALFKELEFKSLVQRLDAIHPSCTVGRQNEVTDIPCLEELSEISEVAAFIQEIRNQGQCVMLPILTDLRPWRGELIGLAIAHEHRAVFVGTDNSLVWQAWAAVLADGAIAKTVHDVKPLLTVLRRGGLELKNYDFDTMVAAYLLDPTRSDYQLPDLMARYLGEELPGLFQAKPRGKSASIIEQKNLAGWLVKRLFALRDQLQAELVQTGLDNLYKTIEHPLIAVLAEMEYNGIKANREALRLMGQDMGEKIEVLIRDIYELAGEQFNINSTKQLGCILFEKLQLPVQKKTKTGYSTDAEVLEKLLGTHIIIDKLLSYRTLVKLKSTYLDALDGLIQPATGRVHTTFNQTVTATGRLSSSDPNLQNIPIRTEEGRKIRRVFVSDHAGWKILSADYSQIELRILAHFSQDPNLLAAFQQGQDVHTRTAALIFGVPMDEVTSEMRSGAKAVNFGIVYGISDFGLSRNIGISRQQAGEFIDSYFSKYPKVKSFMDGIVADAREKGYVTTLLHRRRYLPDIRSNNFNLRSFAERTAMNTPIQGSAADIIKKAMIDIYKTMQTHNFRAKLLLQVHDELVFEVPDEEIASMAAFVKTAMEEAIQMSVPLTVDVKIGDSWGSAEKTENREPGKEE